MCNDGDSTFILGLAAGLASLPSRLECSLPAEDRNVRNHSMGGRLILLPPQGWLIVRSRLEDPWFWKAHESERYVECATDTTLRSQRRPRQGQTVGKRTGSIEPGWIRAGIVAPIQHQFRKGSLMLEGASPLSDRSASSRKSEEVITDATCRETCTCGSGRAFLSMLFMISAYDSIAMYLAIEPQSLCFYVIAASKRKSEFSTEAGSKYLILGRSIYIFPLGLCLDLLCAKSKRLVPMEIPLGLIPRLMTKVESAWRKVKIGGVENSLLGSSSLGILNPVEWLWFRGSNASGVARLDVIEFTNLQPISTASSPI
ncbi:UNVERIFIED_CONTAM: NADH-ubiquinone oxidoreductase chain 2 [Sesamum calycinum]|uniref:NADH-ubiquinone oxidoreductase chain 2 n=1 Tax=Sesamum calycinum TaxID=2727403 RepID=A0AAW2JP41_9LAMI